jgi:hypothetical protein
MNMFFSTAAILAALALAAPMAIAKAPMASGEAVVNTNITHEEVRAAQEAWGAALIKISKDFRSGGQKKAAKTAAAVIDSAYGYNMGAVLFKPTLTHGQQTFRTTREGALSYFVGGNRTFGQDSGFALKPWDKFEYKNAAVHINGDLALTTGNVMLTDKDGKVTTVDKTWGFKKDDQGRLRIVLHHSSLPFTPSN